MLELLIERREGFDESTNQFVTIPEKRIELEHSLRSLSKWEAKHKKPYMSSLEKHRKTEAEVVDYFRCMCLNDVDPKIFDELTPPRSHKADRRLSSGQSNCHLVPGRRG